MSVKRRFCRDLDSSCAHSHESKTVQYPVVFSDVSNWVMCLFMHERINDFFCQLVWLPWCFRWSCSTWGGILHCHQNEAASTTSLAFWLWHCRFVPSPYSHCYDIRICRPDGESYKKNSLVVKHSFSCLFPQWQSLVYMHIKLHSWLQSFWVDQ